MVVPAHELERLADKYRTLGELRRAHARGMPPADTRALRALAHAFPGALNELDTMETAEIDQRAADLRHACETGQVAPWMIFVYAFHTALREALRLKRARAFLQPEGAADTVAALQARLGLPVDQAFLDAIRSPGRRRLVPVVIDAIARWTGSPPDEIGRILRPRRRR